MEDQRDDLLREFSTFGIDVKPAILLKCEELRARYGTKADTFVEEWMAFSIVKCPDRPPDAALLAAFDAEVLAKNDDAKRRQTGGGVDDDDDIVIHDITTINRVTDDDDLLGSYGTPVRKPAVGNKRTSAELGTPHNKRLAGVGGLASAAGSPASASLMTSPASLATTPSVKFAGRTNADEIVCRYPKSDAPALQWRRDADADDDPVDVRILVAGGSEEAAAALRADATYMFGRLRDQLQLLERHIDEQADRLIAGDAVASANGGEWTPNWTTRSAPARSVGRVCCDATSGAAARLNAASLLLQGTGETSSGRCVALDVGQVRDYSLFPGQVVAVDATNPTGGRLMAAALRQPPVPAVPPAHLQLGQRALKLMVACGPFCLGADYSDWSPLEAFLDKIASLRPDVVFLLGPFLDARQSSASGKGGDDDGDLGEDATDGATFSERFARVVARLQERLPAGVQTVAVPSWRDVHHQTVYPTAPFALPKVNGFHWAPDPCVVEVAGLRVGLTSTDVLLHLGKEEISAGATTDRMSRLAGHLLSQQSFYPLYPPAEELSVDLQRWSLHCHLPAPPHLLILPSDLRHFIKNVHGCVVLNPERLVKGASGGTFGQLQIRQRSADQEPPEIRAEVVRI